jgi:hypothetical protein
MRLAQPVELLRVGCPHALGCVPMGYQVHLLLPVDDGGSNSLVDLVQGLIEPVLLTEISVNLHPASN